jgi:spore coat polysaccharide biosynthesis protein SpsF (cytidylyltransferase family)
MKPRVVVAIQARMGSKRLPDKMIRQIGGRRVLDAVIDRLLMAKMPAEIVLATTEKSKDDVLCDIARERGIGVVRGPEEDVLTRLLIVAHEHGADAVMRVTGDSPLVDPALVDNCILAFESRFPSVSFVSTCLPPTYPEGFSLEIVARAALEKLDHTLVDIADRETFMIYISTHELEFPRYVISSNDDSTDIRLTLDYPEDLEVIEAVSRHFKQKGSSAYTVENIVAYLRLHPEIVRINQGKIDREKYPFSFGEAAIRKAR